MPPKTKPEPRQTGRPTILTPEIEREILSCIELGDSDVNACLVAGVSREALRTWQRKGERGLEPYAGFAGRLTQARARCRRNHLGMIARAAQGTTIERTAADGTVTVRRIPGDWRASKFLLACRYPDEFSERHILEQRHTNATGTGPVLIGTPDAFAQAAAAMTPEQLRAVLATDDLAPVPAEEGGGGSKG